MNNEELDQRLLDLVKKAQGYPPRSEERQQLLDMLISEIERSGLLLRPPIADMEPKLYEEIYAKAYKELLQTFSIYIRRNIDKYNVEECSVILWVNKYLRWRFQEIVAIGQKYEDPSTPKDRLIPENIDLDKISWHIIKEDPDGIFSETHIINRPDLNFRFLALRWYEGKSWADMAAESQVSIGKLKVFFHRCLKKFKLYLHSESDKFSETSLKVDNAAGERNKIVLKVKGVYVLDRQPVNDEFIVISRPDDGYIARSRQGEIHKIGSITTEEVTIVSEHLVALEAGKLRTIIKPFTFDDREISQVLNSFQTIYPNAAIYLNGNLRVSTPAKLQIDIDAKQFQYLTVFGSKVVVFTECPLEKAQKFLPKQRGFGLLTATIMLG